MLFRSVDHDLVLSHITGISEPYNVSMRMRKDTPKKLKEPLPVCFSLIHGKHTDSKIHYGGFTGLGRGTALLQTEADLKIYDNLQVHAGGRLLCKVINDLNDEYLIQFTSIPSGFDAWVKALS